MSDHRKELVLSSSLEKCTLAESLPKRLSSSSKSRHTVEHFIHKHLLDPRNSTIKSSRSSMCNGKCLRCLSFDHWSCFAVEEKTASAVFSPEGCGVRLRYALPANNYRALRLQPRALRLRHIRTYGIVVLYRTHTHCTNAYMHAHKYVRT